MEASTPMTREVFVVPPELPLAAAWAIMKRERIRHLPVVQAGALLGILSDRDVLIRAELGSSNNVVVPSTPVGEAMTPSPITCDPGTQIADLVTLMTERKIDAVPVVRGERLAGLVTTTDLLLLLITYESARPLPFEFHLRELSRAEM